MEWNVFYYDINRRKISTFNIFDHWKFKEDTQKNLNKHKNKDDFAEALKSDLMYYFWCKAEWEIILAPWCGGDREKDAIKIDIYEQAMINFDILLNYIWENKDLCLKR